MVTEILFLCTSMMSSFQIPAPDILPQHCVITLTEGVVTVTPTLREAETLVNNRRIGETTMLQHGMSVRFGRGHYFRFSDPMFEEVCVSL